MSWAPSNGMVLSFARGRARRIARELIDLEFQLDVEELTVNGALRLLRAHRDVLRREIDRRIRTLAELLPALDPADALRAVIADTCRSYHARRAVALEDEPNPEIDWALALHALEIAVAPRAYR